MIERERERGRLKSWGWGKVFERIAEGIGSLGSEVIGAGEPSDMGARN